MSDPNHDELIEQAEAVLEATRATMFDVASGEAQRLQEMLEERRQGPE